MLVLMLAATVLLVAFATRGAMATNRPIVEVLHFVGAKNRYIAGQFQRHFLLLGPEGRCASAAAPPSCCSSWRCLIGQAVAGAGGRAARSRRCSAASLSASDGYAGILGLVVLIAAVTAMTSRWTVHRTLTAARLAIRAARTPRFTVVMARRNGTHVVAETIRRSGRRRGAGSHAPGIGRRLWRALAVHRGAAGRRRWRWPAASSGSSARCRTRRSHSTRNADGIVVLTGGASRIADAIELLAAGRGKRLLITGVHHATSAARDRAPGAATTSGWSPAASISTTPRSTPSATRRRRGAGRRSAGFRSLIVVTSNYHMPRAMAELARQLPDVELIAVPGGQRQAARRAVVGEPADRQAPVSEYLKYMRRPGAHAARTGARRTDVARAAQRQSSER